MPSLDDYAIFIQIMDARSISAAAKKQGLSVQNVSRALARIESQLGVTLARRTTRNFVPTRAGTKLLARLRRVIAEIDLAKEELHAEARELAGLIKVSASTLFGPRYLVPAIAAFMLEHAAIKVTLKISDTFDDPISNDVDVALRIGALEDSSLVAKLLGNSRRVLFASPLYIERNGEPKTPAELSQHSCITRTDTGEADRWHFGLGASEKGVKVAGRFVTNNAASCNAAAIAGLGVGSAQSWQVREQVAEGKLRLLLTEFEPAPVPVHLVWPSEKQLTARTRRFVDFLGQYLSPMLTSSS